MDENTISNILYIVLIVMISLLMILSIVYLILRAKSKENKNKNKKDIIKTNSTNNGKKTSLSTVTYNKQSILDFMDFDKIEDNMIIQNDGKRYLMIVECQGVNYDLMSKMEKVSVEEGFQQFLNTLRHPVQIYIQTRTVNLENSIGTYNGKIKDIENKYDQMMYEYKRMKESEAYSKEDLDAYFFEITKQRNLLEYGKDVVKNTEQISLNRNVLNKKYYIVIPYFSEEAANENMDNSEIRSIAFSELYTKAQAVIRTLTACSVMGKILSSKELVELLYIAYNRDESEVFGIDKAYRAGYDDLYSTAPDVYEKKLRILDEEIKNRAINLANQKIEKVKSRAQRKSEEKEDSLEDLVSKMAEIILDENRKYVGEDVAKQAIEEVKKEREGGDEDEQSEKKTTRGRKKTTNS